LTIYGIKWQGLDKEPNDGNDQSLKISAAFFAVQLVTSFQTLIESRIVDSRAKIMYLALSASKSVS